MINIFKYKKLYIEEHEKNLKLLKEKTMQEKDNIETIKSFRSKLYDLENEKETLITKITTKEKANDEILNEVSELKIEIEELQNKVKEKEKARRTYAGKIGGLSKHNHELLNQKKELISIIDRLLVEVRKLSKEKKKPTLDEIKKYFKVKY